MPDYPAAAAAYDRRMRQLSVRAITLGRVHWKNVRASDISTSWGEALTSLLPAVAELQLTTATDSLAYPAAALAAQGLYEAPERFADPRAFRGAAADGRSLAGLLLAPATQAKQAIGGGAAVEDALDVGARSLDMLLKTTIADTGRAAASVDIAARPRTGYVRMLNLPSCGRCVILAGRFYRWNAGFLRHPRCFPAGTVVSGPASEAAARRWYEGELVTLTTASGQELSLTGNHPVLTSRGWIPANLLEEGEDVFRSTRPEGASALEVPDHDQVPALIEDVWRSFSVGGLDTMPTSAEDFHGDGQDGEVDVVYADGALGSGRESFVLQHLSEASLTQRVMSAASFLHEGSAHLLNVARSAHTGGSISGRGLHLALLGAHGRGAYRTSSTHPAAGDPSVDQALAYDASGNVVLAGQTVHAGAGLVGADQVGDGHLTVVARWDAPGNSFSMKTRDGYAARGRELVQRLTGQVSADRIVKLRRSEFRGHVYSLTSSEGWHTANSLIVSNCDCRHIPSAENVAGDIRTDPYAAFESYSAAEQDRHFGKAGAQAIRDGADLSQVVNSRRGMSATGLMTKEGTSRRGKYRQLSGSSRRMTPQAIYDLNKGDRTAAVRDLERYGYILPGGQNPLGALRGQREGFGALGRGGTRVGASAAVDRARETGARDLGNRATMTAAERRLSDAESNWRAVQQGRDPAGRSALTPVAAARAESEYRKLLLTNGEVFTR